MAPHLQEQAPAPWRNVPGTFLPTWAATFGGRRVEVERLYREPGQDPLYEAVGVDDLYPSLGDALAAAEAHARGRV